MFVCSTCSEGDQGYLCASAAGVDTEISLLLCLVDPEVGENSRRYL